MDKNFIKILGIFYFIQQFGTSTQQDCPDDHHYYAPVDSCFPNYDSICSSENRCNQYRYQICFGRSELPSICQCDHDFLYDPQMEECRAMPYKPCDDHGEHFLNITCVKFGYCDEESSECLCEEGYDHSWIDGGTCLPVHGSPCSEETICNPNVEHIICKDQICTCKDGYSVNTKETYKFCYGDFNTPCYRDRDNYCNDEKFLRCLSSDQGENYQCGCGPLYEINEESSQCVVNAIGGVCEDGEYETECKLKYSECRIGYCRCLDGYEEHFGNTTCFGKYGRTCELDGDCLNTDFAQLVCANKKCNCKEGLEFRYGWCVDPEDSEIGGSSGTISTFNSFGYFILINILIVLTFKN